MRMDRTAPGGLLEGQEQGASVGGFLEEKE